MDTLKHLQDRLRASETERRRQEERAAKAEQERDAYLDQLLRQMAPGRAMIVA